MNARLEPAAAKAGDPAELAAAIVDRRVRVLVRAPPDVPLDAIPEPVRTWVRYAAGTVQRGRDALREIGDGLPEAGFRFLDAGCAYGGYLVAAAELGAAEVVGVDPNATYLDIAREVLGATGIRGQVHVASLSDRTRMSELGAFDLVTCADVIEHVDDVDAALANLAAAVAPGGILYLAVPNAWCPANVRQDPHFQWFGISLLAPAAARAYSLAVSGATYYDIGEFRRLDDYRAGLSRQGLDVTLINAPAAPEAAVRDLAHEIEAVAAEGARFDHPRLSPAQSAGVREAVAVWAAEARTLLAAAGGRRWFRRRPGLDVAAVAARYAVRTWTLVARRPRW